MIAKNLRYGMRSDAQVRTLQDVLAREGLLASDARTGNFGPLTLAAVKTYQRRHGVAPVSGFVGPLTRAKLNGS
jgi:peptidoglycan hydrolase-like protein with peptidoglycan-binding domain